MSGNGVEGNLTTWWRETVADPAVFAEVGDVYGIGDLSASRSVDDSTPYGNGNNKKRKEVTGKVDEGSQEYTVRYKKGNALAQAMVDDFYSNNQVDRKYQLRLADTEKTLIVMTSQISSLKQTFPEEGKVDLTFTLEHQDVDRSGVWT